MSYEAGWWRTAHHRKELSKMAKEKWLQSEKSAFRKRLIYSILAALLAAAAVAFFLH